MSCPGSAVDRRGPAGSPAGPVETAVARIVLSLLGDTPAPGGDAGRPRFPAPRLERVDVTEGSKLGEVRAILAWPRDALTKSAWKDLARGMQGRAGLTRVVAVPPALHLTFAPGALERVVELREGSPVGDGRPGPDGHPLPALHGGPGTVVVFCSPNTNKPLHVGHMRACFVGMSISRLVEATGSPVRRSQMLSNFGVHMCQALCMLEPGDEPASAGTKPDHFVGDLYAAYHRALARDGAGRACSEEACAAAAGTDCLRCRPLELLRKMAGGDAVLLEANRRLGEWAIEGILATQARMGTSHDSGLRESETLRLGVETIERAVEAGICHRRRDGSTYVDIRSTGEAELTLLRRDGTSLVFSMLLAVYLSRAERYPGWPVLELTGEQWRAGRTAMYELLDRLGRADLATSTEGVFFGMVGTGGTVVRSREGGALRADDLLDRARDRAAQACPDLSEPEAERLGLAVLKYHVLGFPRAAGFDFDEGRMWAETWPRVDALRRALAPPPRAGPPPAPGRDTRALALGLARRWAVSAKALDRRDPAILVRYLDEVAERAARAARSGYGGLGPALGGVIGRCLDLLDVDLPAGSVTHRSS